MPARGFFVKIIHRTSSAVLFWAGDLAGGVGDGGVYGGRACHLQEGERVEVGNSLSQPYGKCHLMCSPVSVSVLVVTLFPGSICCFLGA